MFVYGKFIQDLHSFLHNNDNNCVKKETTNGF